MQDDHERGGQAYAVEDVQPGPGPPVGTAAAVPLRDHARCRLGCFDYLDGAAVTEFDGAAVTE
ncbi:hypothetical protein NKH77_19920 [Streptomyces sp. M19]